MTTFWKADTATTRYVTDVAYEIHEALADAGVTLGVLFASEEYAVRGMPAHASVKITGKRERALGQPDAVITIRKDSWDELEEPQRRALVDHEAAHLIVVYEKDLDDKGKPILATDELGRPRLKMRRHDCEIGFFFDVVERHGAQAMESRQYEGLHRKMTQLAFPWG